MAEPLLTPAYHCPCSGLRSYFPMSAVSAGCSDQNIAPTDALTSSATETVRYLQAVAVQAQSVAPSLVLGAAPAVSSSPPPPLAAIVAPASGVAGGFPAVLGFSALSCEDAFVGTAGAGAWGGASQDATSSSSGRLTAGRTMSAAPPGYTRPNDAARYGVITCHRDDRSRAIIAV